MRNSEKSTDNAPFTYGTDSKIWCKNSRIALQMINFKAGTYYFITIYFVKHRYWSTIGAHGEIYAPNIAGPFLFYNSGHLQGGAKSQYPIALTIRVWEYVLALMRPICFFLLLNKSMGAPPSFMYRYDDQFEGGYSFDRIGV